jgi:hypothetical protein
MNSTTLGWAVKYGQICATGFEHSDTPGGDHACAQCVDLSIWLGIVLHIHFWWTEELAIVLLAAFKPLSFFFWQQPHVVCVDLHLNLFSVIQTGNKIYGGSNFLGFCKCSCTRSSRPPGHFGRNGHDQWYNRIGTASCSWMRSFHDADRSHTEYK